MRIKEYKTDKVTVQISQNAHNFFMSKKRYKEPLYSIVDHWIDISLMTKAELEERSEKQAKVISIYYDRIKELEKNEPRQTRLVE